MFNVIFDEEVGSFFFTCKEEENMTLEEEFVIIIQKVMALYSANMKGDTVETFMKMGEYILDIYQDKDCKEVLDEIYEANEDTIFLNDESVDEAMGEILKQVVKDMDEVEDEQEKMFIKMVATMYCQSLGINLNEFLKEVNNEVEELDDNEDDLF